MTETRDDAFLGGRLRIRQPVTGYRAGADPVFLAASVRAKPGETVLDLGCGVGTALLCLMARLPEVSVTGVEREKVFADIARFNVRANGIPAEIIAADIENLPSDLMAQSFDHVMFNPPFFDRSRGSAALDTNREAGRGASKTLRIWADVALRRLRPGGNLSVIQRIEQLPAMVSALTDRAGDIQVLPLQPRRNRPAKLFILNAKKGAKGDFSLRAPLILHRGDAHVEDGDSYTDTANAILREGAALVMSN